ncbi:hypothetical protein AAFX91_12665 [Bradyrhizobium sp. 31Argb]|uniref:hypothetical protein n=1 Tax=Bradyrhizobium sp. 31Argb TaxID=3141247 RepID=UPI003748A643
MAIWDNDTKWRQGHFLPRQALLEANLVNDHDATTAIAIVISHDCDLAHSADTEPMVEIVVGQRLTKSDGNYTFAKNVRKLHLHCSSGSRSSLVEIAATAKISISKAVLANHEPDTETALTYEELVVLQRWLVARYQRSAFANEFNRRLRATGVEDGLRALTTKYGRYLRAIFFDVDEGREVERTDEVDAYDLVVILLYDTDNDPNEAKAKADEARLAIEQLFAGKCRQGWAWNNIELRSCEVMADRALSFRDALSFKEWRAEHVSLKAKPPQPFLHEGH